MMVAEGVVVETNGIDDRTSRWRSFDAFCVYMRCYIFTNASD
jgi:hypothetical protein